MKGSITIEVAYILPVIFLVIIMTVWATFYYHDKCIIHGLAYEAGIIGSRHYEEPGEIDTTELAIIMVEDNREKLILFSDMELVLEVVDDKLEVNISAQTSRFWIDTNRTIPLVHQEKQVRNLNKIGSLVSR